MIVAYFSNNKYEKAIIHNKSKLKLRIKFQANITTLDNYKKTQLVHKAIIMEIELEKSLGFEVSNKILQFINDPLIQSEEELEYVKNYNESLNLPNKTFKGHEDRITSLAMTSDNKNLITSSLDNLIKIWDFHSQNLDFSLSGHQDTITCIITNSENNLIFSGSLDCTIKIWSFYLKKQVFSLNWFPNPVLNISLSETNEFLFCASLLKIARFNIGSRLEYCDDYIQSLFYDAEDYFTENTFKIELFKHFGAIFSDKTLKIVNLLNFIEIFELPNVEYSIYSFKFVKDNEKLIVCYSNGDFFVYDLISFVEEKVYNKENPLELLNCTTALEWNNNSINYCMITADFAIEKYKLNRLFEGNLIYALSCDAEFLVFGCNNGEILIWKTKTLNQEITRKPKPKHSVFSNNRNISAFAIIKSKNLAVIGFTNGEIMTLNLKWFQSFYYLSGHSRWISSIITNQNETCLYTGSYDGTIRLWRIKDKIIHFATYCGLLGVVEHMRLSPHEKLIYIVSAGGWVDVWNIEERKSKSQFKLHLKSIASIQFTLNFRFIIFGNKFGYLEVRKNKISEINL